MTDFKSFNIVKNNWVNVSTHLNQIYNKNVPVFPNLVRKCYILCFQVYMHLIGIGTLFGFFYYDVHVN